MRGGEPRLILWDHVAGTVSGVHLDVAFIQDRIEAPKPVIVGGPVRSGILKIDAAGPKSFRFFCLSLVNVF